MSASSVARSPLRPMVPARVAGDVRAAALDQQFGAGAEEAVDPEDHARRVQGEQPGQDVGGDERAIGAHVDLAGQDDLAQRSVVDPGDGAGHEAAPGVVVHHRGQGELARRGPGVGEPAEGIGDHPVRQAGGGRAVPGRVMVVNQASLPRRPITTRGTTSTPGAPGRNGSAPRATAPVPGRPRAAALDGSQAAGHAGHRRGVGETAGKLDAQGDTPPGQPEVLVLPQDSVAARGGDKADVCRVDAGSRPASRAVLATRRSAPAAPSDVLIGPPFPERTTFTWPSGYLWVIFRKQSGSSVIL